MPKKSPFLLRLDPETEDALAWFQIVTNQPKSVIIRTFLRPLVWLRSQNRGKSHKETP